MKRGKDDEKVLGPMFPRLHVNDTEKGGPRAPPRNKMALYEQLSIPSQRFSPGVLPRITNNGNSVPAASSGQANSGRNTLYPLHMPQSARKNLSGDSNSSSIDEAAKAGQRQITGDEDDFTVPVYVQSGNSQCENEKSKVKEKSVSVIPNFTAKQPTRTKSSRGDGLESSPHLNLTQESSCKRKIVFDGKIPGRSSVRSSEDPVTAETDKVNTSSSHHDQSQCMENLRTSHEPNAVLSKRCKYISTQLRNDSQPQGVESIPADAAVLRELCGDRVDVSLIVRATVRDDANSEASIIDSVSVTADISPDDIVGVIGQKQFWKARKWIADQQRMFSVQVFELHRLIKVQKLMAESPHLLSEDPSVFGKTSVQSSPANKLSTECITKCPSSVTKEKEEAEKPGQHNMEYSAENAVAKTSAASTRSAANQYADQSSCAGNFPVAPKPSDPSTGPWGYPQQPGHQWLIPVMSPSEGLIYKPFPAPGFSGPICGGYGPYSSSPFMGNLPNPAYGFPIHQTGPGYFPSYGMPAMSFSVSSSSLEQAKQFSAPVTCSQTGQAAREDADKLQRPSSFGSIPKEKCTKIRPSKNSELQQGSTGNSLMDQIEALATLPVDPLATIAELPTRVIKVVPHNPGSATESAARIFRSIQEERKQYDSA